MSSPSGKTELDFAAREKWIAAVMGVRPLSDAEANMFASIDDNRERGRNKRSFFAALPGIILALAQVYRCGFDQLGEAPSPV